jgi:hypothetical protein
MSFRAACGSFQKEGSSALAFSSSRRAFALSQSKTPPQQFQRLLCLGDKGGDIRSHGVSRILFDPARNRPAQRA